MTEIREYTKHNLEQIVESRGQKAEGREQRAESREQRAESREQRAESREQRAESREQRAESREQRAMQTRGSSILLPRRLAPLAPRLKCCSGIREQSAYLMR
jgi:hypothetical protein